MKFFNIMGVWWRHVKLPSKNFLYKTYYNRSSTFGFKNKFWSDDDDKLKDIELERIRLLIDNYPSFDYEEIKTLKDFSLECIIPSVLYKVNSKNNNTLGIVHINNDKIELYYCHTYLHYSRSSSKENMGIGTDRLKLKNKILHLIK